MIRKLLPRSAYDLVALLALVISVGTGGAYAANTVGSADVIDESLRSQDIRNGEIKTSEIATGAVAGSDVMDNAMTGADINESTLGQVPVAALGGIARSNHADSCSPGPGLAPCVTQALTLAEPARVMVWGRATASPIGGRSNGWVLCELGSTAGMVPDTGTSIFFEAPGSELFTLIGTTGVLPAGTHHFGLDCRRVPGGNPAVLLDPAVTVLAVSPN